MNNSSFYYLRKNILYEMKIYLCRTRVFKQDYLFTSCALNELHEFFLLLTFERFYESGARTSLANGTSVIQLPW